MFGETWDVTQKSEHDTAHAQLARLQHAQLRALVFVTEGRPRSAPATLRWSTKSRTVSPGTPP